MNGEKYRGKCNMLWTHTIPLWFIGDATQFLVLGLFVGIAYTAKWV
jgi:hypothetical protein